MGATVFFADPASEFATLANTFKVAGTATDPTAVSCTVTDPAGTATTHTYNGAAPADITRQSTGVYQLNIACTSAGIWLYKWTGTGAASDVQEGTWTVTSIDGTLYCTVEELKSRLGITDTADDFELTTAVQAACRSIDEACGRYFWRGTDTRTYVPSSIYRQDLDDLVSVTTLKADRDGDGIYEETWTQGTDYQLEVAPGAYNTAAKGEQWPYTGFTIIGPRYIPLVWPWSHQDRLQVTGVFGWPAVPATVKQASLIAAADLFRRKDAPFGIAGFGEFAVRIQGNPVIMQLIKRYITGQRVGV
jgi:hypothetical protein